MIANNNRWNEMCEIVSRISTRPKIHVDARSQRMGYLSYNFGKNINTCSATNNGNTVICTGRYSKKYSKRRTKTRTRNRENYPRQDASISLLIIYREWYHQNLNDDKKSPYSGCGENGTFIRGVAVGLFSRRRMPSLKRQVTSTM